MRFTFHCLIYLSWCLIRVCYFSTCNSTYQFIFIIYYCFSYHAQSSLSQVRYNIRDIWRKDSVVQCKFPSSIHLLCCSNLTFSLTKVLANLFAWNSVQTRDCNENPPVPSANWGYFSLWVISTSDTIFWTLIRLQYM